ncbi:MAG TPA: dTDP-4-dehydrorhamnose 3,5-epimerase [Desulfobulbaceae bacterium]|nr:MAG: dTDP-4-dehydrorhamnose 3,5-epimerase [Deltaproteobacteria bacterium RIFOXYD12_FULL_53_23]HCC55606.1 dTDP-4-dehydrorhamnose 3,5-epimerase [Desulfobulbaceae bacterium]
MRFLPTEIPEVLLIEPQVFGDSRGFFMETWHAAKFAAAGLDLNFVQDNHSKSIQATLRGLHYQISKPQGKLVRVISGEVFDVAVDLRKSSPTFGRWVGDILSAENNKMLWVPPGFAHGFYVLSPEAEFVYKCTELYAPEHERCIRWDDPELGITWPLQVQAPLLSAKDLAGASLAEAELYP